MENELLQYYVAIKLANRTLNKTNYKLAYRLHRISRTNSNGITFNF